MGQTVFLLPDTNFFIQCKDPTDLDWQEFASYECVELIITRPIQAELDNQKGKGSGRVSKRARKASAMIKSLLISDDDVLQIRNEQPKVVIRVRQNLKPDMALDGELMYSERDDQLVGIASTFRNSLSDTDVLILTHDTGPIASAKAVGVKFYPIPDTWLLPPETDESEKRVAALQAELNRLKRTEPEFEIKIEVDRASVHKIDLKTIYYAPLSDKEQECLVSLLQSYYPESEDFGPIEQPQRPANPIFGGVYDMFQAMEVFKPATEEEKNNYKKEYQQWVSNSREFFARLHDRLNRSSELPIVSVGLKNVGTRPSDDNLISFHCRGDFKLLPANTDQSEIENSDLSLSVPPAPPKGGWKGMNHWMSVGLLNHMPIDYFASKGDIFRMPDIKRHDPNGFYWKPSRPASPVSKVSLECEQWRHQIDWEWFNYHLQAPFISGSYTGVFEVELHAKNISEKIEKRYYVNLEVDMRSCVEVAENFIQELSRM